MFSKLSSTIREAIKSLLSTKAESKPEEYRSGDSPVLPCSTSPPPIAAVLSGEEINPSTLRTRLNACQKCGACCAFFPVSFPQQEKDDLINGTLLTQMSLSSGPLRRVMRGTEGKRPRCRALEGEIGISVHCTIYAARPSTCHNFKRSWAHEDGNTLCDKARSVYGMQPFSQY